MTNVQPGRRNMSYRKPVPVYVPSPPPSPPSTSPAPRYNRLSMAVDPAVNRDLPPLPRNWRDAIERATSSRDRRECGIHIDDSDLLDGSRASSMVETSRRELVSSPSPSSLANDISDCYSFSDYEEEMVTPPTSPIPWGQSPNANRKRTLPVEYRPPTPPLPAVPKRERLASVDSSGFVIPSPVYRTIYPDPPSVVDIRQINQENQQSNTQSVAKTSTPDVSLPAASFQPEMRQIHSADLNCSSTAIESLSTADTRDSWSRDTWYIMPWPVPPYDNSSRSASRSGEKASPYPQDKPNTRKFWDRVAILGDMLRTRLRNIKAVTFECGSQSL